MRSEVDGRNSSDLDWRKYRGHLGPAHAVAGTQWDLKGVVEKANEQGVHIAPHQKHTHNTKMVRPEGSIHFASTCELRRSNSVTTAENHFGIRALRSTVKPSRLLSYGPSSERHIA